MLGNEEVSGQNKEPINQFMDLVFTLNKMEAMGGYCFSESALDAV